MGKRVSEQKPLQAALTSVSSELGKKGLVLTEPDFISQGNFKAVVLTAHRKNRKTTFEGFGIAKRNPIDQPNAALGWKLALSRAVSDLLSKVPDYAKA